MKRLKEREIKNLLARHHCNLLLNVSPTVDTSPPFTMYNSPKSIHYRPIAKGRSQSTDNLTSHSIRKQNVTEKAEIFIPSSVKSHNIYANSKSTSRPSTSTSKTIASTPVRSHVSMSKYNQRLASIESKLRYLPSYQAPISKTNKIDYESTSFDSSLDSPSISQSSQVEDNKFNLFSTKSKANDNKANNLKIQTLTIERKPKKDEDKEERKLKKNVAEIMSSSGYRQSGDEYELFKENALNRILQRRVYTASVIEDCFARQMRQNAHLDMERMQKAMNETMVELGVKPNSDIKLLANNKLSEVRFRSLSPLSTSSSGISSTNANNSALSPRLIYRNKDNNKTNCFLFNEDESFPLDAPPPLPSPPKHWDDTSLFGEDDFSDEFRQTKLTK